MPLSKHLKDFTSLVKHTCTPVKGKKKQDWKELFLLNL